jgi:predicted Zn finger-like uncharacterized protein
MIITCDECQARFRLADEKLKPGGTKVRCSKCRHVFLVMPPEPEPAEDAVDFGAFNMEPVTEEEAAPAAPVTTQEPTAAAETPAAAGSDMDLDFSGLEQSMAPGSGESDFVEDFSFVDTAVPADQPPQIFPAAGPTEFSFDQEPEASQEGALHTDTAANATSFVFEDEPQSSASAEFRTDGEEEAPTAGEFGLELEPSAPAAEESAAAAEPSSGLSEFSFETEAEEEGLAFGKDAVAEKTEGFDFSTGESFESTAFDQEPALGEEGAIAWDQTDKDSGPSFDFDEPNFETQADGLDTGSRDEAGMSFGEIDFARESSGATTAMAAEPDFSQATLARPAETESPQSPSPRPTSSRPRSEAPLPFPAKASKSPLSRMVLILVLLLLVLCGAGGYFYFMGDGQQIINSLIMKVKGEEPVAPVEQRIGLKIAGSSYVENRDAGQLLVIQGSVTNNFTGVRSAITVKGVLLDAGGKILQQQTVFCGNYLGDEKLRTLKYKQLEEAMNNQFGDSLSNMNVKPGKELRFTIVFRNLPKELANINVEVVDSKPGGL